MEQISYKVLDHFLERKIFEFILAITKDILVEKIPPFNSGN